LIHSTKKYEYDIANPSLVIFGSSHPQTVAVQLAAEMLGAEAFICRFLIHVFQAYRCRLGSKCFE